jgi:hypothetical protein
MSKSDPNPNGSIRILDEPDIRQETQAGRDGQRRLITATPERAVCTISSHYTSCTNRTMRSLQHLKQGLWRPQSGVADMSRDAQAQSVEYAVCWRIQHI